MDEYRSKLKRRLYIKATGMIAIILLTIILQTKVTTTHMQDFIKGFNLGIASVAVLITLYSIITTIRAIMKEEYLKKSYIEDYDERTLLIHQKVGSVCSNVSAFILIFMTIIAGYFSEIAFFVLLLAVLAVILPKTIMKLYYNKKY